MGLLVVMIMSMVVVDDHHVSGWDGVVGCVLFSFFHTFLKVQSI